MALLSSLTAAHTQSIPFENLDVLLGRPIALEPDALLQKLVIDGRGGYCFEQNGLFLEVLRELGFQVAPISARVRLQRPREFTPPRTHVFLRVELEGESWLTDVGVGALSLTSPLRLAARDEQTTLHEPRRIVEEDGRLFHQVRFGAEWQDVCEFTLEEMPPVDREVGNWYTSAHAKSHFKNRLVVARAAPQGQRLSILNDQFTLRDRHGVATNFQIASAPELLDVLLKHFGLDFPPDTRFGGAQEPWPS
ncbi:MAG TPA: arylamine N-acetyltransferase [Polyangiaceae bacterium]|nr:arylamine N-acetyltransferase [Polyangiaceae bacterium]